MPLFRALAKNMAPMTNADESPTNRLTLFPTTVKVAADWASDSASDWAADWASDSTHFNRSKVHFVKHYFQSF